MLDLALWVLTAVVVDENWHTKSVVVLDSGIDWWDCKDEQWKFMQDDHIKFDLENGDSLVVECSVDEGSI